MQGNGPLRLWTNYFTMAANANLQPFTFTTLDDYRTRHLRTIFVGLATAGISIALYASGQEFSVIDLSRFAAGDSPLHVEFDVQAKIQLSIALQDLAGAAHTNVPVIIGYTVDPNSGP